MATPRRVENKRAYFDFEILEELEAGLVLTGEEVKAFRAGKVTLGAAFVRPLALGLNQETELWLINAQFAGTKEPDRSRKLLVKREQIDRLLGRVTEKGLTLIPLVMYLTHGKIKLQVGLGKGKKQFEKRETLRRRDIDREMKRGLKS